MEARAWYTMTWLATVVAMVGQFKAVAQTFQWTYTLLEG
jgi:hypothetical protein